MLWQSRENFSGEFRMRKTFIIATLGFVLDGGAVFLNLNHNAKSNTYATNHAMHHGTSGADSKATMQG